MDVLVIEHDPTARTGMCSAFERGGFAVRSSSDGASGLRQLRSGHADLVVLDPDMPDVGGFELVRSVVDCHARGVIVVSDAGSAAVRIRCLELGADDFAAASMASEELVARARAVLRRSPSRPDDRRPPLRVGDIVVDLDARQVQVRGEDIHLTTREFDLLTFLLEHPGKAFTRHELLVGVWESSSQWQGEATVTEHVRRVRVKIERDPRKPSLLVSVRGVGYRFDATATGR